MKALLTLLLILYQQIFLDNQSMIEDDLFFHLSPEIYTNLYYAKDREPTMLYRVLI